MVVDSRKQPHIKTTSLTPIEPQRVYLPMAGMSLKSL